MNNKLDIINKEEMRTIKNFNNINPSNNPSNNTGDTSNIDIIIKSNMMKLNLIKQNIKNNNNSNEFNNNDDSNYSKRSINVIKEYIKNRKKTVKERIEKETILEENNNNNIIIIDTEEENSNEEDLVKNVELNNNHNFIGIKSNIYDFNYTDNMYDKTKLKVDILYTFHNELSEFKKISSNLNYIKLTEDVIVSMYNLLEYELYTIINHPNVLELFRKIGEINKQYIISNTSICNSRLIDFTCKNPIYIAKFVDEYQGNISYIRRNIEFIKKVMYIDSLVPSIVKYFLNFSEFHNYINDHFRNEVKYLKYINKNPKFLYGLFNFVIENLINKQVVREFEQFISYVKPEFIINLQNEVLLGYIRNYLIKYNSIENLLNFVVSMDKYKFEYVLEKYKNSLVELINYNNTENITKKIVQDIDMIENDIDNDNVFDNDNAFDNDDNDDLVEKDNIEFKEDINSTKSTNVIDMSNTENFDINNENAFDNEMIDVKHSKKTEDFTIELILKQKKQYYINPRFSLVNKYIKLLERIFFKLEKHHKIYDIVYFFINKYKYNIKNKCNLEFNQSFKLVDTDIAHFVNNMNNNIYGDISWYIVKNIRPKFTNERIIGYINLLEGVFVQFLKNNENINVNKIFDEYIKNNNIYV